MSFSNATAAPLNINADPYAIAWSDYDSDGDPDLYVADFGVTSYLFRNDGGGTFTDVTTAATITAGTSATATSWIDYDNDGDLDLYVTNESVDNELYRNDGSGVFAEINASSGAVDHNKGQSATWIDYDDDGDLDLYVVNQSPNRLFENTGTSNNYLIVELDATTSNAMGIGTEVYAWNSGNAQIQVIDGGSGFLSQGPPIAVFGLGSATSVDSVVAEFPSGQRRVLVSQSSNQTVLAQENRDPVAAASNLNVDEDEELAITLSGTDADGDVLTATVTVLPTAGALYQTSDGTNRGNEITAANTAVTHSSGIVIFVPVANANGSPYTTFSYTLSDGKSTSSASTITLAVNAVQDAPVAVDDTFTLVEDTASDLDVLDNDSDGDGDDLTVASVDDLVGGTASIGLQVLNLKK